MLLSSLTAVGEAIPVYTSSNKYLADLVMNRNVLLFFLFLYFVVLFSML